MGQTGKLSILAQGSDPNFNLVAIWDFDSGDSAGATAAQSIAAYKKAVASRPSSILTLNHETHCTSHFNLTHNSS